jgi:hypothetical protein
MTIDTATDLAATDPLSYAASLLDAVGADRELTPADVALSCLHAAEQLELAGARARPTPLIAGDPRRSIRVAMAALAEVEEDTFARPPVLEAARTARRALRRLA